MALYNEILVGRFNRGLEKLFGIKGGKPAPQLSTDIAPSFAIPLEVEDRVLFGWTRFATQLNVPANVASTSGARMRNPVGSNVIAVFEKILFSVDVADTVAIDYGVTTVDYATIQVNAARLDPRGVNNPTLIMSLANPAVGQAQGAATLRGPALTNVDYLVTRNQELPLLPSDAIGVRTLNVNKNLIVNFIWRERVLDEGERT